MLFFEQYLIQSSHSIVAKYIWLSTRRPGFDSLWGRVCKHIRFDQSRARVAPMAERSTVNRKVVGSIPTMSDLWVARFTPSDRNVCVGNFYSVSSNGKDIWFSTRRSGFDSSYGSLLA